jgi:putative hemolysin
VLFTILFELAMLPLLTLINGAFSVAEMALIWTRKTRLTQKADAGDTSARGALDLVDTPTRFLATVQRGMTLVGGVAGTFGGASLSTTLATQVGQVPPLARPAAWPERAVACRWDKETL